MKRGVLATMMLASVAYGLVGAAAPAGAAPQPDPIRCGATITTDTTLRHDLLNCPGPGLLVGADGIAVNLNGHTIDGLDKGCTPDPCAGVDNRAGHRGVTIRGGSIHQFGFGILLAGAKDNRLDHLHISQAQYYGMNIRDTGTTVVRDNVLDQNGASHENATNLLVIDSHSMVLSENVLTGSAGIGLLTFDLADSRLNGNSLDGNDGGIAVWGTSARNLVRGNEVTHNRGSSIDLAGGTGNRVELNRMADNGDGIILSDERGTTVQQNVTQGTGFYGAPDTGGFGVILDGADANLIRHNVILDGRGPAILVTKLDSPTTADDNTVVGNLVNSRLDDGILIGEGASRTKVNRNVASGNGDDGIDVDSATSTVTANTATHNRDLGIEAVPGTFDGGRNRASANGNPQQCTNIVCTPPPSWSR